METALRAAGLRVIGSAAAGIGISLIWGMAALLLGRRYELLRAEQEPTRAPGQPAQV